VFPAVFLVLAITTKPALPLGSERLDEWLDGLGILIACLGQGFRALAIGWVHNIRRGGREKRIAADALIRTGFFAHSRNSLYLGNLLIFCGLVLIANSYWWYVLALPAFVAVYWTIVLAEEDFLTRKFGQDYADYCRSVNRFVPRLPGLCRSLAHVSFDWKRVVSKETQIFCSWGSLTLCLLIWERWERFGYAARWAEVQWLLLLLGLLFVLYGVVTWLKKSGKLRSS
jgi:protein-S-isoprenylcysteine O-methyltransferase Ste14